MSKLISEQLPNDGGYHIKRLVNEANERLSQIGRRGKRAKIVPKKSSLTLQFSFKDGDGGAQKNKGLGAIPLNHQGVLEAEKIAQMVTNQLMANSFTWELFNSWIGKDISEQTKQLTCAEMVEQFKKHYFKQRQGNKNIEGSWYSRCQALEDVLGNEDKPISLSLVRKVAEAKRNNSQIRIYAISGLVEFLKYFDIDDYKSVIREYKKNNNPKKKACSVPSDSEIMIVHETGFIPNPRCSKSHIHRYPQWQFLYGLLATYGLRIHEAWNIANWDKPVILKNGDWVIVDTENENEILTQRKGGSLVIPAILDPNNKERILCIKHDTKTGYRMAMPLSPEGHNWVQEFNLLQPLNLPDIKNPLERVGKAKAKFRCTLRTGQWITKDKYGFTPHALRHAYNHRGHLMGYNSKVLANSLGHSLDMNNRTYLSKMSDSVKLEGMKDAISKEQNKRSKVELLEEENQALKDQLLAKENDNKLLRTKLKMYEAIEESKGQK